MSLREMINKAKKEKKRAQNRDTAKKVGLGIGIGAAIGSTLGLLFAPKAGKETRADIAQATKNTVGNLKDGADEVGAKIQRAVVEGKERISQLRKDTVDQNQAPAKNENGLEDDKS